MDPQEIDMTWDSPSQVDGIGCLFGFPIAHSMSPLMHNTVSKALGLRWRYSLLESKDINEFLALLKDPKCYGIVIQIPKVGNRS